MKKAPQKPMCSQLTFGKFLGDKCKGGKEWSENGKEKIFSHVEYDGCRDCAFARNIRIGPECE